MSFFTQIIAMLLGGSTLTNAARSSSRSSSGMPKMLFGVLVSLASVVGWQVVQKYKNTPLGKPLENIAKNIGLTDGNTNYPPISTNGQPNYNSNYPRTPAQNTSYGSNTYASNQYPQGYNQQRPTTYPQSQQQTYNQYPQQYPTSQPQNYAQGYPQQYPAQGTQYPTQQNSYPTQYNTGYGQQPYQQQYGQQPYATGYPATVPTASIPYGSSPQYGTGGLRPLTPTTGGMQPIPSAPYGNNTGYGNYPTSNGTNYNGNSYNTNYPPASIPYSGSTSNYNTGVNSYNTGSNNPVTPITNTYGQYNVGTGQTGSNTGAMYPGSGTIKIGSFNIQIFGKSKLNHRDPAVMQTILNLVSRYDVVAIQELRAEDQETLPRFMQMLNSQRKHFDSVIGERLGRSDSKEQYVYVFNTDTIEIDPNTTRTSINPDNRIHRPPLVACFRAKQAPPLQAFTFTLVNIHTDPDDVASELNALTTVLDAVRNDGRKEDDIILLGDLNAGDINKSNRRLDPLTRYGLTPIVNGVPTMTKANVANDNMMISRNDTAEFTGAWGVVDYASEFKLSERQALDISDHRPIWAEFSIYEKNNSQLVRQGNQVMPMSYVR